MIIYHLVRFLRIKQVHIQESLEVLPIEKIMVKNV